jgi:hypothetical protein
MVERIARLTPGEAADRFAVSPKTIVRWANSGRFPAQFEGRPVVIRTPGKHHRFDERAIEALAAGRLEWASVQIGAADVE